MSETEDARTIRVVAEGVESEVADASETTLGHVAMLDVDGETPPLSELGELADEVSVLVETPNGAHVYGLKPRPWREAAEVLDASDVVDREYAAEMDRRGRATLRVSAERAPGLGETGAEPQVVAVRIPPSAETVSGPHARTLLDLTPDGSMAAGVLDALAEGDVDGVETVGDLVVRSTYQTAERGV